jgi:hypothetical protein
MAHHFDIGPGMPCDLTALIDNRLLIQANSGGGKSYLLRRILEQSHGHVQQLVIDPEGEFFTLRERYDYILAAREGGDTIADHRSAKLLAERLLELGVSAILDIYELKAHERIRFVQLFLEALVNAPKRLWHPVLVVVDEAHIFCPQAGKAESAGAVIDLATRGRKRGFCAVLATQRLSKLHKDAAAECNNKLIGRTGLDVDMKRAGDELGFVGREQLQQLRNLRPGEFFAFGQALTPAVTQVKVGSVATTHPKAGARLATSPPPPTKTIKKLLPQLADLPAEAEARAKTLEDLQREVTTLKRELTKARKGVPTEVREKVVEKRVEVPVLKDGQLDRLERLATKVEGLQGDLAKALQDVASVVRLVRQPALPVQRSAPPVQRAVAVVASAMASLPRSPESVPFTPEVREGRPPGTLRAGARRMLEALARRYPIPTSVRQVAQLAGISATGGTFSTYLSDLRRAGYIVGDRQTVELTEYAWEFLGLVPGSLAAASTEELVALYAGALRDGARRILDVLIEAHPVIVPRELVGEAVSITASGGTFSTYVSDLKRAGLIDVTREGLRASDLVMDPAGAHR